jgi:hypothetical protein
LDVRLPKESKVGGLKQCGARYFSVTKNSFSMDVLKNID